MKTATCVLAGLCVVEAYALAGLWIALPVATILGVLLWRALAHEAKG